MKIQLICEKCGKLFEKFPSEIKGSKHYYCCRKCANDSKKNKPSWNKGLTKNTDKRVAKYAKTKEGIKFSDNHKKALSEVKKGKVSPRKGKKLNNETKLKISISKKGTIPWIKGKHHTKETIEKLKKIKTGKKYSLEQRVEMTKKRLETRKKNGTMTYSKPEHQINQLLKEKFEDVICQYKSEKYPFNCDFYIPSRDLYIEFQGHWTHGNHPFSESVEDLETLNKWKIRSSNSNAYLHGIDVWTKRDPLKRKIAKENNLNWLEFFTIEEFLIWFSTIV